MMAKLGYGALTLVGAGLLVASILSYTSTRRFIDRSLTATGTVIRIEIERVARNTNGRIERYEEHRPVVAFETGEGERIEFKSAVGYTSYEVGARVGVLYNPANPREAEIFTTANPREAAHPREAGIGAFALFNLYNESIVLLGIGALCSATGGGMLLLRLKKARR